MEERTVCERAGGWTGGYANGLFTIDYGGNKNTTWSLPCDMNGTKTQDGV